MNGAGMEILRNWEEMKRKRGCSTQSQADPSGTSLGERFYTNQVLRGDLLNSPSGIFKSRRRGRICGSVSEKVGIKATFY